MKKGLKVLLAAFTIILAVLFYLNSNFYIAKQSWKYRDGFHIGDWVEFNRGSVELKGRKVFEKGKQVANVQFCIGKLLIIKSLDTGEHGYYINK